MGHGGAADGVGVTLGRSSHSWQQLSHGGDSGEVGS